MSISRFWKIILGKLLMTLNTNKTEMLGIFLNTCLTSEFSRNPGHCLFSVYITRLEYSKKKNKKPVELKFFPAFDKQMMIGSCKLQTITTQRFCKTKPQ